MVSREAIERYRLADHWSQPCNEDGCDEISTTPPATEVGSEGEGGAVVSTEKKRTMTRKETVKRRRNRINKVNKRSATTKNLRKTAAKKILADYEKSRVQTLADDHDRLSAPNLLDPASTGVTEPEATESGQNNYRVTESEDSEDPLYKYESEGYDTEDF